MNQTFKFIISSPVSENICISTFGASSLLLHYETIQLGPLPLEPLLQLITPDTVTQQSAREINLFSGDDEILSQNAEASRVQLVTPVTNAQLVDKVAVEIVAGQSAQQIQLWMNIITQAQLEDYTFRSHLATNLIQRLAAQFWKLAYPPL
ncbi:MAG: hypothetical protein EZS28_023738 [Streblomastix strix]|uniref:Uncharacterized protein n=1 Tax=Streblomastix strix TaxID=222440 RepID=A0A5J4VED2_9EUKA|nr:MAG: hypothetical protein EZS28_023738 [Streblomastix strix]